MATMTAAARSAFLNETRLGILSTLDAQGDPVSVPVWFEWDGAVVRFFSFANAPKVTRLRKRPRASLLVVNNVGEGEAWVSFYVGKYRTALLAQSAPNSELSRAGHGVSGNTPPSHGVGSSALLGMATPVAHKTTTGSQTDPGIQSI